MGLQDIANFLPEREREMILRRVRNIKNNFFRELFTIKNGKKKNILKKEIKNKLESEGALFLEYEFAFLYKL